MLAFYKKLWCFCLMTILAGCGSNLAPVSELTWHPYSRSSQIYRVQLGDTLYAIAFRYDTDFRTLASLNHISPPYYLRAGQVLTLRGIGHRTSPSFQADRPYKPTPILRTRQPIYSPPQSYLPSSSGWLWPVRGRVTTTFSPEQGKKGINIACTKDEKIIAASSGVIAYAGSGLAGYGNLIIIKHSNEYLTAYGNNSRIMVSEGQQVKRGQVIAVAGVIDHHYTGVHFEIRRFGRPVNPLNYLRKS